MIHSAAPARHTVRALPTLPTPALHGIMRIADPPQCVLLADQPDPLRALQGLSIGVLAKKGRS
jgi:hypothetical protein